MPPRDIASVIRLPLGTNNVYALPDPAGATLIDAGPDYQGAWDELIAQLHMHDIAAADVHTLLLTHAHLDHAGMAARWQATGARIFIGRDDADALQMRDAARESERDRARREMIRHGVPPETLSVRPAHGERYTRWPAPLRMSAVEPDGILDGGECAGASGRPLRVVAAPGHTPGTVLFLDGATRTLFSGDHILPRMAPTSGIQFDGARRRPSLPDYLASLRAIRDLSGQVTTVLPGHGEPIDDLAAAIDWTTRLLEQRARRVLAHLRNGPTSAYAIASRMFPHVRPHQLRPLMSECIGLLDLLGERGQAFAEDTGDVVIWRAIARESG